MTLSPIVILTILLCYTATLEGADIGVDFYLSPDWEALKDLNVWSTAAVQITISLALGCGSMVVLASFGR